MIAAPVIVLAVDNPRLLRVQFQADLSQPGRDRVPDLPGPLLARAVHDHVVAYRSNQTAGNSRAKAGRVTPASRRRTTVTDICYTLADCLRRHAKYPATFEVPQPDEIARLKPGDTVKLIFELPEPERHESGMEAERLWVRISSVLPGGRFTAELDNEPSALATARGHWVEFEARHIADIYPADDRHLWALVADNRRRPREMGYAGYDTRACDHSGTREEADPTVIRKRETAAALCDACAQLCSRARHPLEDAAPSWCYRLLLAGGERVDQVGDVGGTEAGGQVVACSGREAWPAEVVIAASDVVEVAGVSARPVDLV